MVNRQGRNTHHSGASGDRWGKLGPALAAIPERLLLAHARGEVLFIVGAGVSRCADLPDFRGLVLKVLHGKCLDSNPIHASTRRSLQSRHRSPANPVAAMVVVVPALVAGYCAWFAADGYAH